ncbi:MAG TPA: OadG family protein [Bacillota bacterium]|nr:OadG family protein [Bacillota bacterium]
MSTEMIRNYTILGALLLGALLLFGVFYFKKVKNSNSANTETEKNQSVNAQQEVSQDTAEPDAADDLLLIAVITAALAAHLGKEVSGIKVSSIHRIVHLESGWAAVARQETIASRQSMYNL